MRFVDAVKELMLPKPKDSWLCMIVAMLSCSSELVLWALFWDETMVIVVGQIKLLN